MAAMAYMAELAGEIKTVFFASAPGAAFHPFIYQFVTFYTPDGDRKDLCISFGKSFLPDFTPIISFLFNNPQFVVIITGYCLKHSF